jgi:hypothetical protein
LGAVVGRRGDEAIRGDIERADHRGPQERRLAQPAVLRIDLARAARLGIEQDRARHRGEVARLPRAVVLEHLRPRARRSPATARS